jgi:hypothetical protein
MNRHTILTDTDLHAMLVRRAGPETAPLDLAKAIEAALAKAPEGARPWWSPLLPPMGASRSMRTMWVLVLIGLVLAATASVALVGSELLRRMNELAVVPPVTPAPSLAANPSLAPSYDPGDAVAWPVDRVNDLAFAPDGSLWLAGRVGVVRWDVAGDTATVYSQRDGLPAGEVELVTVAPDGTVWAAGRTWLARYDGSWAPFTAFGEVDSARQVGGMTVDRDGVLHAAIQAAGSVSYLLRYDGEWTATKIAGAAELDIQSPCSPVAIAPDRTVWVGSCVDGVLHNDGGSWTRYPAATAGLPAKIALAGIAADGAVWVTTPAICESQSACSDPGHGVARFDGTRWTVYGTEAGLADTDVQLQIGRNGGIWATYERVPGVVSRFDPPAGWTTFRVPELGGAGGLGVAPDGALWLLGSDALLRYDGATLDEHALPTADVTPGLPALELPVAGEPTRSTTGLGAITWQAYRTPDQNGLYDATGTAHGPVVIDYPDLRWLLPDGTWDGTNLPIDALWVTTVDDEVIAFGHGAVRLTWNGSRWIVGDTLDLRGAPEFVRQFVAGPRGIVVVGLTSFAFSNDGVHFALAEQPPDAAIVGSGQPAAVCRPPSSSSESPGAWLYPVVATEDGFVAFTPASPFAWTRTPMCEPVTWFSPDGSSWALTSHQSPFGPGAVVWDVASYGGRYVAVGGAPPSDDADGPDVPAAWVSDDALAWQRVPVSVDSTACELTYGCAGLPEAVAGGASGWIAVGGPGGGGAAWVSPDGRSWEELGGGPRLSGGWYPPIAAIDDDAIVVIGYQLTLPDGAVPALAVGIIEP